VSFYTSPNRALVLLEGPHSFFWKRYHDGYVWHITLSFLNGSASSTYPVKCLKTTHESIEDNLALAMEFVKTGLGMLLNAGREDEFPDHTGQLPLGLAGNVGCPGLTKMIRVGIFQTLRYHPHRGPVIVPIFMFLLFSQRTFCNFSNEESPF
jgi:hypothetical protein